MSNIDIFKKAFTGEYVFGTERLYYDLPMPYMNEQKHLTQDILILGAETYKIYAKESVMIINLKDNLEEKLNEIKSRFDAQIKRKF